MANMKRRSVLRAGASGLAGVTALAASACGPSGQPEAAKTPAPAGNAATQVLRLPEGAKIVNTMDPGITSGGNGLEQIQNMFEGLVYVDQNSGEIKPGQAEK